MAGTILGGNQVQAKPVSVQKQLPVPTKQQTAQVQASDSFLNAYDFVQKWEKGYVNDPRDRGGETNYGISKRSYPHLDIKKLTKSQARDIFHRDYWSPIQGDSLPRDVATVMFDMAVNNGTSTATKYLQKEVGSTPDGRFGPKTTRKLTQYLQTHSSHELAMRLIERRRWLYRRIAANNKDQRVHLASWIKRVDSLERQLINEEIMVRNAAAAAIAKKAMR